MKTYWGVAVFAMMALFCGATNADNKAIEQALKEALPGVKPDSITPSAMAGLFEVVVGPKLFYVSEDGRYLFQGSMIDIKAREDLTEGKLANARISSLKNVGSNNMIAFKPESSKHLVYVFTDIDCGYCRKLHSEIDQYLTEGIEIRYLFFPRAGEGSDSYNKAVSVWCAEDRNAALTKAKRGDTIEKRQCENPVDRHLALGTQMGAAGTPMLVTEKGNILPGYVPAAQLAKILSQEAEK